MSGPTDEQGQHAQKCLIGRHRAKLHDVGCHIIHNACCEAGLKSQREVVVRALGTNLRLDFTVVDAEALHYIGHENSAQAAAQAERTKDNKHGKTQGGVGDTGMGVRESEMEREGEGEGEEERERERLCVTSVGA